MNVGFLGLGAMGMPMARNLHKANLLQAVWNRTNGKSAALAAELHCTAAATPAQLAAQCEVMVIWPSPRMASSGWSAPGPVLPRPTA